MAQALAQAQLGAVILPGEEPTLYTLLNDALRSVETNLKEDIQELRNEVRDVRGEIREVGKQAKITNGRVTQLEIVRARATGAIFAFKWLPWVFSALFTVGLTILGFALTGNIH